MNSQWRDIDKTSNVYSTAVGRTVQHAVKRKMRGKFIGGYLMDKKHMPAWIILLIFVLLLKCSLSLASSNVRDNWVVLKTNSTDKHLMLTQLQRQNFTLLYEITPLTSIFEYSGYQNGNETLHNALQSVLISHSNEIVDAEVVRIYEDTLKPIYACEQVPTDASSSMHMPRVDVDNYYGKDISNVWSRGYSGSGVTFAIVGAGLDTKLLDFQRNVKQSLSFNFVTNTLDVKPDIFPSSQKKALQLTDLGNGIASVLAAEKDNSFCSTGICYNGNIVAIKAFDIRTVSGSVPGSDPTQRTTSDILAIALVHHLDEIDISVNAWTTAAPFDPLDLATREAIAHGATKGRNGLGIVHVVPAGPVGNVLTNNIHTITVGMFGVNGTIPHSALADASVLTSGLGYGSNITSSHFVTASHHNKCIKSFRCYQAAASYVGGIIGLGMEANPKLSLRDIQHLLVRASEHTNLQASATFKPNAASHYFNEKLGFGLLNAEKFVSLCEDHEPVSTLLYRKIALSEIRVAKENTRTLRFCYICDIKKDIDCLTTVEHVVLSVKVNAFSGIMKMEAVSPSGTRSVLMNSRLNQSTPIARFVSVHFWNEMAFGDWELIMWTTTEGKINISDSSLILYGTQNQTLVEEGIIGNNVCEESKSTSASAEVTVVATSLEPDSEESKLEPEQKQNITLFIVLPVGILCTCGIMAFIIMRGNSSGPISSYGMPLKKTNSVRRRRCDSILHRQISLLRQKSRHDSTSEDVEGEMSE